MKLESRSLSEGARIPASYAMGVPGDAGPVPGPNKSPHLAWSGAPDGTKSFVIICHDCDVPSRPDDVNKPDRSVPYDLPRVDFFHWVLADIPVSVAELAEAQDADGVTPKGKPPGPTAYGKRGINSYTDWFSGDADMGGDYGGYDGPWPPFNDERIHHYTFTVFALDVASLDLPARFSGPDVRAKMKGHILAQASISGTYALNENAR
ncbi:MAG TPA: YbhB/YbcL family Raf kinase inhibitor-like protein [Polyangiaceae bacterium]|nr:YbhB/YbcL family Raf kinase inhibitor-like protein [Polyangiaceae bacterium]HMR77237.1 YbhB/YbcL family Raf kinase inhibitor-like protein [Polyangiaceae bacterium]